jgi:hypothetical protein
LSGDPQVVDNRVNLKKTTKLRKKIQASLASFVGEKLVGDTFYEFVSNFYEVFPKTAYRQTFQESLQYLAGDSLSREGLEEVIWRMSGNVSRLRQRRKVLPWSYQPFLEWVPAQVIRVIREPHPQSWTFGTKSKLGWTILFRVLAGLSCPSTITQWWSVERCAVASRAFGFSRRRSPNSEKPAPYPYKTPQQFTLLMTHLLIDPALSNDGPEFERMKFPPSVARWNRDIHVRRRRETFSCPEGHPRDFQCYRCPQGWDSCPASTHKYTFDFRPCPICSLSEAPYDPEMDLDICLNCHHKNMVKTVYGTP